MDSVIVLCFVVRFFIYVPSSFAIILMGKRELVALLGLSSWCLVIVVWLFLTVPWVGLQFVIVVFPDHTHSLFFTADLSGFDAVLHTVGPPIKIQLKVIHGTMTTVKKQLNSASKLYLNSKDLQIPTISMTSKYLELKPVEQLNFRSVNHGDLMFRK